MKERADSEQVSPTAYATGYFWYRHGLSHEALLIPEGARVSRLFGYLIRLVKWVSGMSIEALMLARHRGIDALLARRIEAGEVRHVIELACGLSPRGWRFMQRYGERITYTETDLPHMAQLKRKLLADAQLLRPGHRVVAVNALHDAGPESLVALAASLPAEGGVAIVTEGLLSYIDPPTARGVWRRIAATLRTRPFGVYLSDAYVASDRYGIGGKIFRGFIERFVRGRMHVHFESVTDAVETLKMQGFSEATLHEPRSIAETRELGLIRGGDRVRILEAVAG